MHQRIVLVQAVSGANVGQKGYVAPWQLQDQPPPTNPQRDELSGQSDGPPVADRLRLFGAPSDHPQLVDLNVPEEVKQEVHTSEDVGMEGGGNEGEEEESEQEGEEESEWEGEGDGEQESDEEEDPMIGEEEEARQALAVLTCGPFIWGVPPGESMDPSVDAASSVELASGAESMEESASGAGHSVEGR